ncbi:DUF4838 domain-containing protein [Paenibacillus ginsengarvi]|uniref:DUF4838 domain-containing protein n=1 Tax=Paenibacillus ginsengarvi TaxID=400777 RepID=A0A3B0BBP6_9BACL|nr:DUF4838 domain-containing protein [Paenibacillus ginsengarvi]RKN70603.1 DUF4838 domain-containing protein [Paenibacillus ginsengarvi]
MHRRSFAILLSLIVMIVTQGAAFAAPSSAEGKGKQVMLANNGKAHYGIFVRSDADEMEQHAAQELTTYLTQVTGAPFQLSEGVTPPGGPTIVVGRSALTEGLVPELTGPTLGEDGFVIGAAQRYLVIAGSHPRGTMYGVNFFLDTYVGVKWYSPTYTFVPTFPKLQVCVDYDVQVPRFLYREMYVNDGGNEQYRAHNLLNGKYRDRYTQVPQSEPWLNSWSTYWPYDVHNFKKIVPQTSYHYGNQLLAMNENVRSIAAANLISRVTQQVYEGKDASYGFSQEDTTWSPDPDSLAFAALHGGTLAAPIMDMVGDVATRVKAAIPNARIGTLAYMFTEEAPTNMTLPDNVVVTLTPIYKDHGRALNDPKNSFSKQNAERWAQISDDLVFWDYLVDFSGGGYLMPYPSVYAMGETIQFLADFPAFKGYFGELIVGTTAPISTGLTDLRAWVGAKLLWNPNLDYRELIDEFVNGYYGEAAPYMSQYMELLHQAFAQSEDKLTISTPITSSFLSFDLMRQIDGLFAQAAAATSNPVYLNHVQRTRIEVDYTILMRYVDYMMEAQRRNIVWDPDFDNRYARFKTYTADVINYKSKATMTSLYKLIDIRRTLPTIPDFVSSLPYSDWLDYQDHTFRLYEPVGTTLVSDAKASDKAAAKVKGSTNQWAIQLPDTELPREGRWNLYASVRIDPGTGSSGAAAMNYGFSSASGGGRASIDYGQLADGDYHFIALPWVYEYNPNVSDRYYWFAPPNSTAIQNLYVDRIIAVRQ